MQDIRYRVMAVMSLTICLVTSAFAGEQEEAVQKYRDSLVRIELIEPAYRGNIYSTQPQKRIVVRLTKKAELLTDAEVSLTLTSASGGKLAERALNHEGETAVFDATALAPGEYTVLCATSLYGQAIEQSLALRVLPAANNEVYFDSEGICYANGRPFFPRGPYHLDGFLNMLNEDNAKWGEARLTADEMFERVAAQGFNTAVVCGHGDTSWLDLGAKHNLRVLQFCDLGGEPFKQWVMQIREHPALLAYAPVDEPWRDELFRALEWRYGELQQLDPYHPVEVTQCYSDLFATTATVCDILAIDSYPLRRNQWWLDMAWWNKQWNSPLRLVSRYCGQVRSLLGPQRPFWFVVQAFGDEQGWEEPTPAQLRSQAYQAIVAGARGLLFYSYIASEQNAEGRPWWIERSPLWEACRKLNAELHELEPVLLAPGGEQLQTNDMEDVRALRRDYRGRPYIFVVNIAATEQQLQLTLLREWQRAQVKWEDYSLPVEDGVLSETLEPFAVRVYQLRR